MGKCLSYPKKQQKQRQITYDIIFLQSDRLNHQKAEVTKKKKKKNAKQKYRTWQTPLENKGIPVILSLSEQQEEEKGAQTWVGTFEGQMWASLRI